MIKYSTFRAFKDSAIEIGENYDSSDYLYCRFNGTRKEVEWLVEYGCDLVFKHFEIPYKTGKWFYVVSRADGIVEIQYAD